MQSDGKTLVKSIKRELEQYDLNQLSQIQQVFSAVKGKSDGGIVYISISDASGNVIVSDEKVFTDASSSASASSSTSQQTGSESANTDLNVQVSNDVYNISEPLSHANEVLNIGLSLSQMQSAIDSAFGRLIFLALTILILTGVVGFILTRILVKSLKRSMEGVKKLASGELTVDLSSKRVDEFGQLDASLTGLAIRLREVMSETHEAINELNEMAHKMSTTGDALNDSSHEVALKTDEISKVIQLQERALKAIFNATEQLSLQLDQMNLQAKSLEQHNREIEAVTNQGRKTLTDLTQAMNGVEVAFASGTEQIGDLNQQFKKINEITVVIDGVAQQTNLLALNAAIEAARAGESGRGFAVVADEIRILAEQVIDAAKNINTLIKGIDTVVEKVSRENEQIAFRIDTQQTFVSKTVSAFTTIESSTALAHHEVTEFINRISEVDKHKTDIKLRLSEVEQVSIKVRNSENAIEEAISKQAQVVSNFGELINKTESLAEDLKDGISHFKIE